METHRNSEVRDIVNFDRVLVTPDVIKEVMHDPHGLVPDQLVVFLNARQLQLMDNASPRSIHAPPRTTAQ